MSPNLYSPLFTDLYQLTMAHGYFKAGLHDRRAVCHLTFRRHPLKGNYAIVAGLQTVVQYLQNWRFQPADLQYLSSLRNRGNQLLFTNDFLDYLKQLTFTGDIDAMPEGTLAFVEEPILKIEGPLLQCQLLETALLTIINFQTLIATNASRICQAAGDSEVIEFGMRRAQGLDGALSAARAAFIGGCVATSNVLAGQHFGIPVRGTHAHNWVVAFGDEKKAFDAYAALMPYDSILLVDTFNAQQGIQHAIETGQKLREKGFDLLGIRLDSGDLFTLSKKARARLDEAGFHNTRIIVSNELNETVIRQLKQQQAPINTFGVGTHLVTAYDGPALEGVYKLSALQDADQQWTYRLKLSESLEKMTNPGRHQVKRFMRDGRMIQDIVYDCDLGCALSHDGEAADLLMPIYRNGKPVVSLPPLDAIRQAAMRSVSGFLAHWQDRVYLVQLEERLVALKKQLVQEKRHRT